MSNSVDKKVLVIGLDGFEQSIANRLMEAGRMPHLQQLIGRAARMDLDHGPARRTGLAWEHFATGLSPSGAQRWSAVTFDPHRYSCRQEPTRLPPPSGGQVRAVAGLWPIQARQPALCGRPGAASPICRRPHRELGSSSRSLQYRPPITQRQSNWWRRQPEVLRGPRPEHRDDRSQRRSSPITGRYRSASVRR